MDPRSTEMDRDQWPKDRRIWLTRSLTHVLIWLWVGGKAENSRSNSVVWLLRRVVTITFEPSKACIVKFELRVIDRFGLCRFSPAYHSLTFCCQLTIQRC